MITLRLAGLLARRTSPATVVLPVVAFAVTTALLLIVTGGSAGFFAITGDEAIAYQTLTLLALGLLVVPLIGLGGASARLSTRRRDERMSTLRLIGATSRIVATLAVLESALIALVGALAGAGIWLAAVPGVALLRFRGAPLGIDAILLPAGWVAAVVGGIVIVAATSAMVGLRAVVLTPLGVRTRQNPPRMHWLRLVAGVAVIGVVALASQSMPQASRAGVLGFGIALAVGFGGTIAVLNLVGPWVIGRIAASQARRATTPHRLIAARWMQEAPKDAWRQVSGTAMTSFLAVFAGTGIGLVAAAGPVDPLIVDIRTGVIVTVVASFVMVACGVGVNQAAAVLDRADLYVSLDRLGMPEQTMDRARRRAIMSPLRIVSIGSALIAVVVLAPLAGMSLIVSPLSLVAVAACLLVGMGIVRAGLAATRPVLRRVLAAAS